MAKKVKQKAKLYYEGDKVVVRSRTWAGEERYDVGIVTNVNAAGKKLNSKRSYDIRTERGSGLIYTSVDEPKSNQTIITSVTNAWLKNGGTNNMFIHKKHGHTRGNYAQGIELRYDGQTGDKGQILLVNHFEKYNDFVFPTQGPRSF